MRIKGNNIHAVYDDKALELYKLLGTVTVTRYSSVEFSNASGVWEARRPNGDLLCEAASREASRTESQRY